MAEDAFVIVSGFSDEISESFDVQLSVVRELGMEYISLRTVDGKNIAEFSLNEIENGIIPRLKAAQIKVSSIGSPIGKVEITDEEGFVRQTKQLEVLCKAANLLDCKYIRVFSFFVPKGKHEECRENVIAKIKLFAEIAEKYGVVLIHENEKDIYGDTKERCADIVKTVDSQNLKLAFDFANFVQCGEKPLECWALLKDYVVYIHIKDAVSHSSQNVLCGTGEGCIAEILQMAISAGYRGFLTLEPHLVLFAGLQALEKEGAEQIIKENLAKNGADGYRMQYNALCNILTSLKVSYK